jgi:hypothetical protein
MAMPSTERVFDMIFELDHVAGIRRGAIGCSSDRRLYRLDFSGNRAHGIAGYRLDRPYFKSEEAPTQSCGPWSIFLSVDGWLLSVRSIQGAHWRPPRMSALDSSKFVRSLFSELLVKQDERRSFLIAMALVAASRAQAAFDYTYAVDDYRAIIDGFGSVSGALIAEGRFGTYWLSKLFEIVGYDPMRAPFITILASIFLSVWTANAVLRLWSYELSDTLRVMLLVIVAAHPYTSEILTFRNIAIYHLLAFALAGAAILISRLSFWGVLVSSLVFAVSLTFYQVPLNYISIFICFDLALRAIRHFVQGNDVPVTYSMRDRSFHARLLTFLVGFTLYWISLKISTHGLPPHPFSVMIDLDQIPNRLQTYGLELLYGHFVTGSAYASALVPRAILFIPLMLVAAAVLELAMRPKNRVGSALAIVVALAAPVAAGFAMLGISLLFTVLWLPPRVLADIGLVWAGVAVVAISVRRMIPPQVFAVALGLVVFTFVVRDNQIFVDQARVGTRDHNLALRLISKLEEQPNFSAMKAIAVVGKRLDTGAPIPTAMHGFNDSNFEYQWAIAPMLTELSGIPIRPAYQPELADAQAYCKERVPWPAAESVLIRGELAIVCL